MSKRASIITLGCRLNHAESALLHARLHDAGYTLVPHGESADLAIVNTCTVTAEADAKSRKMIRAFIRQNPGAFVAVIGCMLQLHAQQVAQIHGVDLVMGNANKLDVLQHVTPHKNPVPAVFCNDLPDDDFTIAVYRLSSGAIARAVVAYGAILPPGEGSMGITVYGSKGTVMDGKLFTDADRGREWRELPLPELKDSFWAEVDHFLECLQRDEQPIVDVREGARNVAACLAAVEASKTGRPVAPARF